MPILKKILLSLLAVFLIFEEWLWDALTALGRVLARWLHLERFERWLAAAPRGVALLAFAIPLLIVTPINLIAFWMIAKGIVVRGIVLEIFAKLLGTLLVARVFTLTKNQLMTFAWFAWLYRTITGWLRWAHARVAATAIYRASAQVKARIKLLFKNK